MLLNSDANVFRCYPDCPNRTATCKFDGSCDVYAKARAEYEERGKKIIAGKRIKEDFTNYIFVRRERMLKR